MKYLILLALVAFVSAAPQGPQRPVWPRLPVGSKPVNDDTRIVGGEVVSIADYQYQVTLLKYNSFFCGGSVIAERVILTAAHCTYGQSASAIKIRLNSDRYNTGGTLIQVAGITVHPNYSPYGTTDYDVSLLHLAQPIQPIGQFAISLAPASSGDFSGKLATVSGWGTTSEGGYVSTYLRAVDVNVITNELCNDRFAYGGQISDDMMCAAVSGGGKDACQGDSGGPLALRQDKGHVEDSLVGVVSWGYGCARPTYPGVYARVSYFHDWIVSNM